MLNRTERITRVVTIFGLLLTTPFLMAPLPVYMTVPEYPGSVDRQGREDTNENFSLEHQIQVPIDPASGLPSGSRRHHPLVIQKAIDRSTPGFYQALTTNMTLPSVTLDFYRISPTTRIEEKYFVITLINARIIGMRNFFPNVLLPENGFLPHMEEVTFAYQTITWEWLPDGLITQDNWGVREP